MFTCVHLRLIIHKLREFKNYAIVDGNSKGIASPTLSVYGVSPDTHTMTCKLSGYSDDEKTVTVAASSTTTVTCSPPRLPLLSVSPDPSFNLGTMNAEESASQTFSISNTGGGTLTWSISDDQPWITINPTSGTNSGTVTININTAGLNPGIYSGIITVTSNGGAQKGSISLNIRATQPTSQPIIPTQPTSQPIIPTQPTSQPITPTQPQQNGFIIDKDVILASISALATIMAAYFGYRNIKKK